MFEFTEAQVPGRRRGAEYDKSAPSVVSWPVEKWPTKDQIFEIVRNAAALKQEKARKLAARGTPYQRGVGLFIYLNVFDFWDEDEQKTIVDLMGDAVQPAKDAFCSVWVSWHGALYDLS